MKWRQQKQLRRLISFGFAVVFGLQTVLPSSGRAQDVSAPLPVFFHDVAYVPPLLKGMALSSQNPFELEFFIDSGDADLSGEDLDAEFMKLVKYFLAALTTPESEMWVNLNPAEPDRIVPALFGRTGMGRDLLTQDYALKQLTTAVLSPENEAGAEFWKEVRARFGEQETVNLAHKIWIIPEYSEVIVRGQRVFVAESRLKVMLEDEYLDFRSAQLSEPGRDREPPAGLTDLARQMVLPSIEREINYGEAFAPLRQIFHSLILAVWYKEQLRLAIGAAGREPGENSMASGFSRPLEDYADQQKVGGLTVEASAVTEIYQQYLRTLGEMARTGWSEVYDPEEQRVQIQQYVVGGVTASGIRESMADEQFGDRDPEFHGQMYRGRVGLGRISSADQAMSGEQMAAAFYDFRAHVRALLERTGGRVIVVFDKDDTLVLRNTPLTGELAQMIQTLVEHNGVLILSSGDSQEGVLRDIGSPLQNSLPDNILENIYLKMDNGARVLSYSSRARRFEEQYQARLSEVMTKDDVQRLVSAIDDVVKEMTPGLDAVPGYAQAGARVEFKQLAAEIRGALLEGVVDDKYRRNFDPAPHLIRTGWARRIQQEIAKLGLADKVEVKISGTGTLNISLKGIDKGSGLEWFESNLENFSRDEMIVFGDQFLPQGNDRHMIEKNRVKSAVNVGDPVEDADIPEGVTIINSPLKGPAGARAFFAALLEELTSYPPDRVVAARWQVESPLRQKVPPPAAHRNPRRWKEYDLPEEIFGVQGVNLVRVFNDAWNRFAAEQKDNLMLPNVAVLEMMGSAVYSLNWMMIDDLDVALMFDLASSKTVEFLAKNFHDYLIDAFNLAGVTTTKGNDGEVIIHANSEGRDKLWEIYMPWSHGVSGHVLDRIFDQEGVLKDVFFSYLFDRNYYLLGRSDPDDWTFSDRMGDVSVAGLIRETQLNLRELIQSGLDFFFGENRDDLQEDINTPLSRLKFLKRFASVAHLMGDDERSKRLLAAYSRLSAAALTEVDNLKGEFDFELAGQINQSFADKSGASFWNKNGKLIAYRKALMDQGRQVPVMVEDLISLLKISPGDIYQRIVDVYELNLSGQQLMALIDKEGEALTLGQLTGFWGTGADPRESRSPVFLVVDVLKSPGVMAEAFLNEDGEKYSDPRERIYDLLARAVDSGDSILTIPMGEMMRPDNQTDLRGVVSALSLALVNGRSGSVREIRLTTENEDQARSLIEVIEYYFGDIPSPRNKKAPVLKKAPLDKKAGSPAMMTRPETPGGIDLDPRLWEMSRSGLEVPLWRWPRSDDAGFSGVGEFDGYEPFIIQLTPVSSFDNFPEKGR